MTELLSLERLRGLTRGLALPAIALSAAAALLILAVIIIPAQEVTKHEQEHTLALTRTALQVRQDAIGRSVADYAHRGEVLATPAPLRIDAALAAHLNALFGYEAVLSIGRASASGYAARAGGVAEIVPEMHVEFGLQALVDTARAREVGGTSAAVTGLVGVGGRPAIAAAAALPSPRQDTDALAGEPAMVLVFIDVLDDAALTEIGEAYMLDDLRLGDPATGDRAVLPLATADWHPLGTLTWQPEELAEEMPGRFVPLLILAVAVPATSIFLVLRRMHRRSLAAVGKSASALRFSETRFRDFAEAASDWMWETDAESRFTYLSDRHEEVTGIDPASRLGRTRWEVGLPAIDNDPEKWGALRRDLDERRVIRDFRFRVVNPRGRLMHIRISGKPVYDEAGTFLGYRGTGSDITAEVEAAARARHLAFHDALTGLPNRVLFMERLEMAAASAVRLGSLTAILCIDLDHFKEINDTRGHAAGDQVLKIAAERFLATVRMVDTVARLGGDEFAIVQTDVESLADVQTLCQRLIDAFVEPFAIDGPPAHVGLSIGVALAPIDAQDPADLLRHADLALYRAKSEGRGEFRLFEPAMDAQLRARKQLEHDLRQALARGEFSIEYQPQVEVASGRILSAEALLRWNHPAHGWLPPATFIPIAEQTGLIVPLGEWVLREACRVAAGWGSEIRLSVNLSPVQVRQPGLVDQVAQILETTGFPATRLELEVTEGVLLRDTEEALGVLESLKDMGVHIAMDDFGTGYSSLSYLQRFPFDRLKIDGSFVRDLFVSTGSAAIIRAVIGLGRGLGISVTAEGVETEAQLSFLEREGCVAVQGFHLGRPMRPDLLAARLAEQRPLPARRAGAAIEVSGPERGLAEDATPFMPAAPPDPGPAAAEIARELGLVPGSLWLPVLRLSADLSACSRSA